MNQFHSEQRSVKFYRFYQIIKKIMKIVPFSLVLTVVLGKRKLFL